MNPFIRKLSKELGKDESVIEKAWKDAKKLTAENFGIGEEDFTRREIEYTKEIVREQFGVDRMISVTDFLESDKSAKDFISEVVTSGDFPSIDKNVISKSSDDDENEEEMDDEDEEIYPMDEARKDGTPPDGTGPHGRGNGPGKGRGDGTGMKNAEVDDEDEDEDETDESY